MISRVLLELGNIPASEWEMCKGFLRGGVMWADCTEINELSAEIKKEAVRKKTSFFSFLLFPPSRFISTYYCLFLLFSAQLSWWTSLKFCGETENRERERKKEELSSSLSLFFLSPFYHNMSFTPRPSLSLFWASKSVT